MYIKLRLIYSNYIVKQDGNQATIFQQTATNFSILYSLPYTPSTLHFISISLLCSPNTLHIFYFNSIFMFSVYIFIFVFLIYCNIIVISYTNILYTIKIIINKTNISIMDYTLERLYTVYRYFISWKCSLRIVECLAELTW